MVDRDRTTPGGRHRLTTAAARPQILTYTVLIQHMVYWSLVIDRVRHLNLKHIGIITRRLQLLREREKKI